MLRTVKRSTERRSLPIGCNSVLVRQGQAAESLRRQRKQPKRVPSNQIPSSIRKKRLILKIFPFNLYKYTNDANQRILTNKKPQVSNRPLVAISRLVSFEDKYL